jgi:hypothetical protein
MKLTYNKKYSHTISQNTPNIQRKNNYTWNSTYKGMARKNDFTSEIILLYGPQKG